MHNRPDDDQTRLLTWRERLAAPLRPLMARLEPIHARLEAGARRIEAMIPTTKRSKSDLAIMGLGGALGLGCALFPWYVLYNQEQFGIREFQFSGGGEWTETQGDISTPHLRIGLPFATADLPRVELDGIATGTLGPAGDGANPDDIVEQPFPGDQVEYRLIHVENGRAMIADDAGIFVVQAGSQLPDGSRLRAIEERDGRWVIVTTLDRVVVLGQ